MILGFRPRYVENIIMGRKVHTIRKDIHNRWEAGMMIQFATGVRTKRYKQFMEKECKSVQRIAIFPDKKSVNGLKINIDGRFLSVGEINALVFRDGFDDKIEFRKFFNDEFSGNIIHWTDLSY